MPSANEVIIAAAGSGKTSRVIQEALADRNARVLITTYTRENLNEVAQRLWVSANGLPHSVSTLTWFEFLLREGVKPYQSFKTDILRIRSVNFVSQNPPFSSRSDFARYYMDGSSNIYSDAMSDLACVLNSESRGKVVKRIETLYDLILIDEMQDLAGWDLEFAELLLNSRARVLLVGDPRQAVYSTNRSNKNLQYRGTKIVDWVARRVETDQCVQSSISTSYRCNQAICDFADGLYPALERTTSANTETTEANDVHLVHTDDVDAYRTKFAPQALRWNRSNLHAGPNAQNLGEVKGREFARVLIYPTSTMLRFLEDGVAIAEGTLAKLYVGATRARHSVGIVTGKRTTNSALPFWSAT